MFILMHQVSAHTVFCGSSFPSRRCWGGNPENMYIFSLIWFWVLPWDGSEFNVVTNEFIYLQTIDECVQSASCRVTGSYQISFFCGNECKTSRRFASIRFVSGFKMYDWIFLKWTLNLADFLIQAALCPRPRI